MIHWDEESIRFMQDSSEHVNSAAVQARHILPYLPPDAEICEGGCGLGSLSLALSPQVRHITAVDRSIEALAVLRREIRKRKISNITAVAADIFTMQPRRRYDAMVFCRFGAAAEILKLAAEQCGGTVVVLTLANSRHRFTLAGEAAERKEWFSRQKLDEWGIPCRCEQFEVETGQPFRSMEDAVRFFQIYDRRGEPVTAEQVRNRLIPDPQGIYPLFSPMKSDFRLLTFEAEDARRALNKS